MKTAKRLLLMILCILLVLSMPALGVMEEEPEVLSPRAQAFRDRLIRNAQQIYNQEMAGFESAALCLNNRVNHRLNGYVTTLHNANQYNLKRDFVFEMTEIGVNIGIAGLTGDMKTLIQEAVTTDIDLIINYPVNDLLEDFNVTIPPTTTTDMIYTLAD